MQLFCSQILSKCQYSHLAAARTVKLVYLNMLTTLEASDKDHYFAFQQQIGCQQGGSSRAGHVASKEWTRQAQVRLVSGPSIT